MTYKQFTKCVQPDDYSGLAPGLIATAIAAIALLIAGVGWGVIGITASLALIAYCRWWLYGRLVCLGGDVCAVGLVIATHPPSQKSGFDAFDTDYSIDLLLAPDTPQDCVIADKTNQSDACLMKYFGGFQAHLIQRKLMSSKFPFQGEYGEVPYLGNPAAKPELVTVPVLHAEFEGGGVQTLYDAAKAALVVSSVGAVLCMIPVIGWIACLIAGLITAAILGIAALVALSNRGSPTDVNPDLDELHSFVDVLVVKGSWVYDSAHEGWNEIHPIKQCQRIKTLGGGVLQAWPKDIADQAKAWCEELGKASSPLTRDSQSRPENQWEVHPFVDGCTPASDPPQIR